MKTTNEYLTDVYKRQTMFWGAVGYWQTNFFKPHLDYFRGEDTTNPLGANPVSYTHLCCYEMPCRTHYMSPQDFTITERFFHSLNRC